MPALVSMARGQAAASRPRRWQRWRCSKPAMNLVRRAPRSPGSPLKRTRTAPGPPGVAVDADDLAGLASKAIIAKYQLNPRSAVVYLRNLEPGEPLILRYHLTATMPVKVTVPGARAYEYYDTDKQGFSKPAKLTV